MRLLPKREHYNKTIRLTDVDGETMDFKSVVEAAKFLDVTKMAVYQALKNNGKCRGCKVERV